MVGERVGEPGMGVRDAVKVAGMLVGEGVTEGTGVALRVGGGGVPVAWAEGVEEPMAMAVSVGKSGWVVETLNKSHAESTTLVKISAETNNQIWMRFFLGIAFNSFKSIPSNKATDVLLEA